MISGTKHKKLTCFGKLFIYNYFNSFNFEGAKKMKTKDFDSVSYVKQLKKGKLSHIYG